MTKEKRIELRQRLEAAIVESSNAPVYRTRPALSAELLAHMGKNLGRFLLIDILKADDLDATIEKLIAELC